jgi:hypothetical protein
LFGLRSLLGAFLVWLFISIAIHPFLKLVKGKGKLRETAFVFLYCASALHLLWIPIFSVFGKLSSNTEVVLTYPYLITYGYGDWHDIYLDEPFSNQSWNKEQYIKEEDPDKETSALIPVSQETGYASPSDWHKDHPHEPALSTTRVPLSNLNSPPPTRVEFGVIRDAHSFIRLFVLLMTAYYLTHFFYLAKGLAIAHNKRVVSLFSLAIAGPIGLCILIAGIGWLAGRLFLEFATGVH